MRPRYLSSSQIEEGKHSRGKEGKNDRDHERQRHTDRDGQRELHTWLIRRTALEPDKDMNLNISHCKGFPVFTGNALKHTDIKVE